MCSANGFTQEQSTDGKLVIWDSRGTENPQVTIPFISYRVLKGGGVQGRGVQGGGGNWGTLKIPREDWGTLGNIRKD